VTDSMTFSLPPALVRKARDFRGTPAPVRAAATVVLLRPAAESFEAYVLKRATTMAFGGMYAFPGGGVDESDRPETIRDDWAERLGVPAEQARAVVGAAARELFEEAGVLLAGPVGRPDRTVGDVGTDDWEADRVALESRELAMSDFCSRRGLVLRSDLLGVWAGWQTPVFEPRRYRTWFFVAELPSGQRTRDVSSESSRVTWLPAVVPVVVHHNRRPWTSSTQVLDVLDLDPDVADAMQEHLPRFRFILDDLSRVDEQALRARPVTPPVRVTLLLLKIAAGNPNLADDLQRWAGDLRAVLDRPGGIDLFAALLRYIELVGEAPTDELHKLVATLGSEAEEAYVTTADMLRAEGEARGEARGKARGHAAALVQLLTLRFGPVPQAALDVVHAASIEQLEAWTARVLTAGTLDDVLR